MIDVISDSKSQRNICAITLYSNHGFLLSCMDTCWELYAAVFSQPCNRAILDNGAIGAIILFISVFLHELMHSVIALRYGIKVRQIILFIFGGVSEIP